MLLKKKKKNIVSNRAFQKSALVRRYGVAPNPSHLEAGAPIHTTTTTINPPSLVCYIVHRHRIKSITYFPLGQSLKLSESVLCVCACVN